MRIRYFSITICAVFAALILLHPDAFAKARPNGDDARAARTIAPTTVNAKTGVKLAQLGGRRVGGRRVGGRRFGVGPLGGRRFGGRRFGGRRVFGRRFGRRRYYNYTPIVPFVYGGAVVPYYYYYYDDYPAGRCAYWHRRCVANWGYRNSNYYGCMRYYGCSRY